jgi:hypothetical protein
MSGESRQLLSLGGRFNEPAKQAEEFSPGWSEAKPGVGPPMNLSARVSGRQSSIAR